MPEGKGRELGHLISLEQKYFPLIVQLLSEKINQVAEFWTHIISMVTKSKVLKDRL